MINSCHRYYVSLVEEASGFYQSAFDFGIKIICKSEIYGELNTECRLFYTWFHASCDCYFLNNVMTELLELVIAELKKLPDGKQNEVAIMIFKQIQPRAQDKLSSLWQKVDELGADEEQPTMSEIITMVKQVRHSRNWQ